MATTIKTQPNSITVEQFLQTVDSAKLDDTHALINLMRDVSGQEPVMWGTSIVGFGSYRYQYTSGRTGDWMKIGFSPRKNTFSLYLSCDADQFTAELAELGSHTTGKGCIYFKRLADINLSALKALLTKAYQKEQKAGQHD